jgi:SAM-dependent methyltransferase
MFIKLDEQVVEILCCPFCKGELFRSSSGFGCDDCGSFYPLTKVVIGQGHIESVYDFRLRKPDYCLPQGEARWQETQDGYEKFSYEFGERDSLKEYLDEIDTVKEIYTEEFHLSGKILDVGGHQGRLRHFLKQDGDLYVSIDPHIDVFCGLDQQPNLLEAYPCLSEPCNFLAASAEHLPFKSRSFDWVHMRSVADHFSDPYSAFLEAYRVSKVGGKLLVGLAILDKIKEVSLTSAVQGKATVLHTKPNIFRGVYMKWKRVGMTGVFQAAMGRLFVRKGILSEVHDVHDDHMFRFSHKDLIDLMEKTGWSVSKQHWQKPPYYYCIYAMGEAQLSQKHN